MRAIPTVTGENSLSNSFISEAIQICIVTRDHRKTMDGMVKLGIGPWRIYTFAPENLSAATYRGQPANFSMKLCIAYRGAMMWEIIEPLEGPSIYKDFLAAHGEGVHHVAVGSDLPWQQRVAEFEARGFANCQSGIWKDIVPFAYFETEGATTTCFEIFDIPQGVAFPAPEAWFPAPPPGF